MVFFDRLYDVEWTVAFRPHQEDKCFDTPMTFQVMKNTWRYWCADPFPFDYDGKTYVFMEVADKTTQKGMIGYRVIENGNVSPIRICIKTPYHMSYPMIYTQGDEIYMIPECFESKRLTVYRAVAFPDRWEPCETILEDKMVCDTNYLSIDGMEYLLTMPLGGKKFCYDRLELYQKSPEGRWQLCPVSPLILGEDRARNAGHFFFHQGQLIRPSQNCGTSYGEEVLLNRVDQFHADGYRETLWKRIGIDGIQTNRNDFDGIHTFNRSASYDVIDLRKQRSFQPARLIYFIQNKMKRFDK